MTDERTLDRRSLLGSVAGAGLAGLSGFGALRASAQDGGDGQNGGNGGGENGGGSGQNDVIDYFRAVFPITEHTQADLVYRILVVGGPIMPHERPPALCFPKGPKQWFARDALVVKPTQRYGQFGNDDSLGAIDQTRAYVEEPVEPGTAYRISGGHYCGDHASVTVHELPPRLSEHFSTQLDDIPQKLKGVGNETAGNATAGNRTAGNESIGNETAGNATAGNRTAGNETAGNGTDSG